MMDPLFFGHNDPLFSSTASVMTTSIAPSEIWQNTECQFDMPTPPVSPSRNDNTSDVNIKTEAPIEEDLDLGLGELISGLDLPSGLFLDGFDDPDSWLNEVFQTDSAVAEIIQDASKCDSVNELRHDCMWAGHCPAEEHRSKKDLVQLPCLLSSSPPETTVLSLAALPCVLPVTNRTRLDTLGSVRPETPLSLSDSELDADQLTSDEGNNKSGNSSSSSSADESESDEDRPATHYQPTLPPNIHPVRNHQIRKLVNNNKSLVKMVVSSCTLIPDHSYSHSDHSYHTQRRPISSDQMAIPFDLGAPTPSDSGESLNFRSSSWRSIGREDPVLVNVETNNQVQCRTRYFFFLESVKSLVSDLEKDIQTIEFLKGKPWRTSAALRMLTVTFRYLSRFSFPPFFFATHFLCESFVSAASEFFFCIEGEKIWLKSTAGVDSLSF